MAYEQKPNTGVLFKNDDKLIDTHADYRGSMNVDGKEYFLDAWINTSKKDGRKFMSLRLKPKMAREHPGGAQNPPAQVAPKPEDDFDDSIPF